MYANIIEEFPFECSILSDPRIMLGRWSLKLYSLDFFIKFIRSMPKVVLLISGVIFFCGTAAEVTPISEVDYIAIGPGKPGPVTGVLANLYFDAVHGRNEKYLSWLSFV